MFTNVSLSVLKHTKEEALTLCTKEKSFRTSLFVVLEKPYLTTEDQTLLMKKIIRPRCGD